MDIEQTLESLDFEPEGLPCDVYRSLWAVTGIEYPAGCPDAQVRGCPNTSRKVATLRLCPCWADPRKLKDFKGFVFDRGLLVSRITVCEPHLEYFQHYLNYPFLCPGCGVHYSDADALLLNVQQTC